MYIKLNFQMDYSVKRIPASSSMTVSVVEAQLFPTELLIPLSLAMQVYLPLSVVLKPQISSVEMRKWVPPVNVCILV